VKITEKKSQILTSALALFSRNGIETTSTASIAKAANVATGTLFHHFANKKALVHQLYLSIKHELSLQFSVISPGDSNDDLKKLAQALWNNAIDWAFANPDKLKFCQLVEASHLLTTQDKTQAMAQELGMIIGMIEHGQQTGCFAPHPVEMISLHCQAQFFTSGNFYIDNPQFIDNQRYREASFDIFWHALCPIETNQAPLGQQ